MSICVQHKSWTANNEQEMPLKEVQIKRLDQAITSYAFPPVYFDFNNSVEVLANSMAEVETIIGDLLRSHEAINVKHGLANILYWGYAQIGYRRNRVRDFMDNVSHQRISAFQALINGDNIPTMMEVRRIHMPQYSGVSFLSKILMFLNPDDYCVLDRQLAQLRTAESAKALNNLTFGQNETQIRITRHNEAVYNSWREECSAISQEYFHGVHRVVDVERGFFNLIQQGNLSHARAIYNAA